jgi:ankyrin repeat protein
MSIHHLAERGDIENLIRLTTERPYLLQLKDAFDRCVFDYACLGGNLPLVEYLVSKLPDIPTSSFHYAVIEGHLPIVTYLLSKGANPSSCDEVNRTPAYKAAQHNQLDVLVEIISHKGDINTLTLDREPPLLAAIQYEHIDIVKLLLYHDSVVTFKQHTHQNAVWSAIFMNNMDLLEVILESGKVDFIKYTWIIYDIMTRRLRNAYGFIKRMLEFGCSPNGSHSGYYPPLIIASKEDDIPMVELLLKHGADVNATGYEISTALLWSVVNHNIELINLLLSHGADVNAGNLHGTTILDFACTRGRLPMVEILIRHGADVTMQTLFSALEGKNINVVKYLIHHGLEMDRRFPMLVKLRYNSSMFCTKEMALFILKMINIIRCSTLESAIAEFESNQLESKGSYTWGLSDQTDVSLDRWMDLPTWYKLIDLPIKHECVLFIRDSKQTEMACYLALYEEHETMVRFRQGDLVDFSPSPIRNLMRPYGARPMRNRVVSYLVHPMKLRKLLW